VLNATGLRKSFGGVEVLHGVDVQISGGKVVAMLGENGAGKSTTVKIISGVYQADGGHITINEQPVAIDSPRAGQDYGIRVIYQEMMNAPTLSVAENIFLGHLPNRSGFVNWRETRRQAEAVLSDLGVEINAGISVGDLSVAQHQVVEIARALVADARLLVFDEPTSALSPEEVDSLFSFIRRLRDEGVAILYITHRLNEVPEIADEVVIFRDGDLVAQGAVAEFDRKRIVEAMTGEALKGYAHQVESAAKGRAEMPALTLKNAGIQPTFKNISFDLYKGEIVSLFGRMGCGAMEVGEALFGLHPLESGTVTLLGTDGQPSSPINAKKRGLGYVPVDRKTQGLLQGLSSSENLTVAAWSTLSNLFGFLSRRSLGQRYDIWRDKLSIRGAGGGSQEIGTLSGGNQQKVILGRWLENNSAVLVLAEPTRGVDVGARAEIYEVLENLANDGIAILIISTDAEEVLRISDRIVVMSRGAITSEISRADASLAKLAEAAAAVA
jgi:ribose transport system ATP-binding protein